MRMATVTWCPDPTGAVVARSIRFGVYPLTLSSAEVLRELSTDKRMTGVVEVPCGITGVDWPRQPPLSTASCPKCGKGKIRKRRDIRRCPHCGSLPILIDGTLHWERSSPKRKKRN